MALLLFSLRSVPEDEAQDIRELLEQHEIDFYETNAGNWGISMPAIWLVEEAQHELARHFINEYQAQRQHKQQRENIRLKQSGETDTFFKNLKRNPMQTLVFIAASFLVLYVSIKLVFDFGL